MSMNFARAFSVLYALGTAGYWWSVWVLRMAEAMSGGNAAGLRAAMFSPELLAWLSMMIWTWCLVPRAPRAPDPS